MVAIRAREPDNSRRGIGCPRPNRPMVGDLTPGTSARRPYDVDLIVAGALSVHSDLWDARDQDCDEAQGYHFRKPPPASELLRYLRNHAVG